MDTTIIYVAVLLITGVIAGFSSGLIGVGGCFLMVPVQFWLLSTMGMDSTLAIRVAFGTSLAVALPTALSGTLGHHRRHAVLWDAAVPIGIAAVIGALLGGTIAANAPGEILRIFFGIVVLVVSVRMIVDLPIKAPAENRSRMPAWIVTGFGVGILSGLVGMGGGVVMVPIMVIGLGFSMHQAVGTSSACILFSSAGGVIAYIANGLGVPGLPPLSVGYVELIPWAILVATTIPFAQVGVRAAHRLPARKLRRIFAVVMAGIGVAMLFAL